MKMFFKYNYKFFIFLIVTILILTYPMPYVISNGGGISDLSTKFTIENSYPSKGSFNLSYVSQVDATLSNYLLSKLLKWDVESASEYQVTDNETLTDVLNRSKIMLKVANQNSIIVAYKKAGKEININSSNYFIAYIFNDSISKIKIGDIFYKVNDEVIEDFAKLNDIINNSEKVKVTVIRDGKEITEDVKVITDKNGDKMIGVASYNIFDFEVKPEIKFSFENNESGGSAGLMTTLAIYNALVEEDITHGLKIAGTGTINVNGEVGAIGGVGYKLSGAVYGGADVFFVPAGENYEEALKVKEKKNYSIELIPVSTFDEALEYLNKLKK